MTALTQAIVRGDALPIETYRPDIFWFSGPKHKSATKIPALSGDGNPTKVYAADRFR